MTTSPKVVFITGTDTDVGKTCVASALLQAANSKGLSTAAIKPVAAGALQTGQGLRNNDAVALLKQCSIPMIYEQVNPNCFPDALAPHLAASKAGHNMTLEQLKKNCQDVIDLHAKFTCIEGVGGWAVPVNDTESMADLPALLDIPVILVVGLRLGCINHALLTAQAITRSGTRLAGWVANHVDCNMNNAEAEANIHTLKQRISSPLIGALPFMETVEPEAMADYFDISLLAQSSLANSKD